MSQVQEIKDRLDIAEIIGGYVDLHQAGKNFKGVCPFHNERTPSFFVSPDRGTYHCFGCSRGGDVFSFVQDIEGVDFVGALKMLAERAGVELTRTAAKQADGRERLHEVLEQATVYYQKQLVINKEALAYLRGRGVLPETMKAFRLGFAPDSWEGLRGHLFGLGYTDEEMERAGLTVPSKRGRGSFDRFRSRIMFPFTDPSGRVVGFSGRIFGKEGEEGVAKYVNTPETELYHKSEVLFGFHHAKQDIRREGRVVLVEGQMDLILSHQAGHRNTVAVSGTGLTEKHMTLLRRFCRELLIALDADHAGLAASDRVAVLAEAHEISVQAVAISGGKDPADVILENEAAWTEAVRSAQGYIPFRLEAIRSEYERQGKEEEAANGVRDAIFPHIQALYGGIRKDNALKLIANALGVSPEAVREEFESWRQKQGDMLRDTTSHSAAGHKAEEEIVSRRKRIERKILGVLLGQGTAKEKAIDTEEVWKRYSALTETEKETLLRSVPNEEREKMVFEAEVFFGDPERLEKEIDELFTNLEIEILTEKLAHIGKVLRGARVDNEQEADDLVRKYQEFSRRREELKSRFYTSGYN